MSTSHSGLTVHLETTQTEWVIGTPFAVNVTLRNETAATIDVPDQKGPSPFLYGLTALDPGRSVQLQLSKRNTRRAIRPEPRPDPALTMIPLAPGEARRFAAEDIGGYLVKAAPAGRYALQAGYQQPDGDWLPSAPLTVTLRTPLPRLAVYGGAPRVAFASNAFVDAAPHRPPVLYLREVVADGAALVGAAYPLVAHGIDAIDDLAVSTSLEPAMFFRWVAWRLGDQVSAGFSQLASTRLVATPAHPELTQSRLHPTGWQYAPGEAEFAALGLNSAGEVMLATLAFAVEGGDRADVFRLPTGLKELPDAWAVTRLAGRGADASYLLVFASTEGRALALHAVVVGQPGLTSRLLYRGDGPLAALSFGAWPTEPSVVDLLLGPAGGDPPVMTFLRLSAEGGAPLIREEFPMPRPAPVAQPAAPASVADWALPLAPSGSPVILTNAGGRLVALEFGGGLRTTVVHEGPTEHLGMVPTRGGLWAVWFSETLGFSSALLRR